MRFFLDIKKFTDLALFVNRFDPDEISFQLNETSILVYLSTCHKLSPKAYMIMDFEKDHTHVIEYGENIQVGLSKFDFNNLIDTKLIPISDSVEISFNSTLDISYYSKDQRLKDIPLSESLSIKSIPVFNDVQSIAKFSLDSEIFNFLKLCSGYVKIQAGYIWNSKSLIIQRFNISQKYVSTNDVDILDSCIRVCDLLRLSILQYSVGYDQEYIYFSTEDILYCIPYTKDLSYEIAKDIFDDDKWEECQIADIRNEFGSKMAKIGFNYKICHDMNAVIIYSSGVDFVMINVPTARN